MRGEPSAETFTPLPHGLGGAEVIVVERNDGPDEDGPEYAGSENPGEDGPGAGRGVGDRRHCPAMTEVLDFLVVCEARADHQIATELADRVVMERGPDWLRGMPVVSVSKNRYIFPPLKCMTAGRARVKTPVSNPGLRWCQTTLSNGQIGNTLDRRRR